MPKTGMRSTDKRAEQVSTRRMIPCMPRSALKNALDVTLAQGKLPRNSAKATFADAAMSVIAIGIGFGMAALSTTGHGLDCRSPQPPIAIGTVVLMAGCFRHSPRAESLLITVP